MIKIFSSSVDLDESDKATVPGIKQQFFPHRKKEKKNTPWPSELAPDLTEVILAASQSLGGRGGREGVEEAGGRQNKRSTQIDCRLLT